MINWWAALQIYNFDSSARYPDVCDSRQADVQSSGCKIPIAKQDILMYICKSTDIESFGCKFLIIDQPDKAI